MKHDAPLVAYSLIAALALAVVCGLFATRALADSFSLLVYLLANAIVLIDMLDLMLRLYLRRAAASRDDARLDAPADAAALTPREKRLHLRPYALVASIHNAEDHLDEFLDAMRPYRDRLWLIDDGSADETCLRVRQAGWRCVDGTRNRKKPGAIRALLASLPADVETVMVLDPDIVIRDRHDGELSQLEQVAFDFQRSKAGALCPRIAIAGEGLLARLQSLEYCLSFELGRASLAEHSITSGIALYRRSALEAALRRHSLSVYAEDLENAVMLLAAGERVHYDGRLVIETEGVANWRHWFSQRVGWYYGLIKVYIERLPAIRQAARHSLVLAYQYFVYFGVLMLLLHPLRVVSTLLLALALANGVDSLLGIDWIPDGPLSEPLYFLDAYAKYLVLAGVAVIVAVPSGERVRCLSIVPLYFFYALAQVLPITLGFLNWFALRIAGRRLYRDHYEDDASLRRARLATTATEQS